MRRRWSLRDETHKILETAPVAAIFCRHWLTANEASQKGSSWFSACPSKAPQLRKGSVIPLEMKGPHLLKLENISVRVACFLPLHSDGLEEVAEGALGPQEVFGTLVFGVPDVLLGVEELLVTFAWLFRRSE